MSNAVFTKRGVKPVCMHFDDKIFECRKEKGAILLYVADEETALLLGCKVGDLRGCIEKFSDQPKLVYFSFRDADTGYAGQCLFTFQTSSMPFIAAALYPHKNML